MTIRMTEPDRNGAARVPDHQPIAGGIAARARAAAAPDYLAALNPEQHEAVATLDGPVPAPARRGY
jgi:DNA helicase-2/ATP-dependent DNA helicase PcrA